MGSALGWWQRSGSPGWWQRSGSLGWWQRSGSPEWWQRSGAAGWWRCGSAVGALAVAACAQPTLPNIVLVTLDTTRADRLGVYGHASAATPNLDRFARTAVVYERAYATSSWTLPSHASLFTGLLPMQHGAQTAADGPDQRLGYPVRPLAEEFSTLAERLGQAGYRTAAVVAGPALARELGVAQGFEHYDDALSGPGERVHGRRAEVVADRAIERLAAFGDAPFFLFVNFFDPHAPYRPPPPHDRGLPEAGRERLTRTLADRLLAAAPPGTALPDAERAELDALLAGYDAEIAYMDRHLGRLLDALDASARARETFVAITSDHGESFGEHHLLSHGAHLYEDNVRVPLLVRTPGAVAGRRVGTPLQNHRLFATALALAGIAPADDAIARPLEDAPDAIVLEVRRSAANVLLFGPFFDRDLRALLEPPYKWIGSSRGDVELYRLDRDEAELVDLAAAEPDRARALADRLEQISRARPPRFDADARAELTPQTEEALRALGYLD